MLFPIILWCGNRFGTLYFQQKPAKPDTVNNLLFSACQVWRGSVEAGGVMGVLTSGSRRRVLMGCACLGGWLAVFSFPCAAQTWPRLPWFPPLPELVRVTHQERFDAVYLAGVSNEVVTLPRYGTLRASWSGYSLERVGTVRPFLIPGLDESGRVQVTTDQGAVRFWFRPYWDGGKGGLGAVVTLAELAAAELAAAEGNQAAVLWSLQVSAEGSELKLFGSDRSELLLAADLAWAAGSWHQVVLNYGTNGTELVLDGEVVAGGGPTLSVPARVTRLVVGSSLSGEGSAGGELEEVYCFGRPLRLAFHYVPLAGLAALGPMTAEELAYRLELLAKWTAVQAGKAKEAEESGGGQMLRLLSGQAAECVTNAPLYLTNAATAFITNQGWTVTFEVQGTNGPADIFSTTNLSDPLTNSFWVWLERGPSCSIYRYTNQPVNQTFYILGTALDSDFDGLTDAYEKLVSHSHPQVWNLADLDGDGLPDAWEVAQGLDPLTANGSDGPDADALTNLQEYLGGTRPLVAEGFGVWVGQPQASINLP